MPLPLADRHPAAVLVRRPGRTAKTRASMRKPPRLSREGRPRHDDEAGAARLVEVQHDVHVVGRWQRRTNVWREVTSPAT